MSIDSEVSPMSETLEALRNYWHPVALSSAVTDKPIAVVLLNTDVVIWRNKDGIFAFKDLCVHRGTRLSIGWIDKGELVCPYHGWCYSKEGAVTRIPSIPPERPIPAKARVEKYRCEERYGLVFVCLGEPRRPLYEVPASIDSDKYKRHVVGPVYWKASAARSFENFFDEAHLPWAHDGYLGSRENVPLIPQREVQEKNGGFYYEVPSWCGNRIDKNSLALHRLTYDLELPFTVFHGNVAPDGTEIQDLFFSSPVTDDTCVRFMVVWRNYSFEQPTENFVNFTKTVWEQDRVLVENQRPEQVPIDLNEELHLRGPDGPSVVYRRMLGEIGVHNVM
jgi:phenylpropionate dioxygenase-like ring-hydroxylating dioxygenase large terminal subunit